MHELLGLEFSLTPKLRYAIPFYYRKSWICYLKPNNNGSIELAFTRGNELSNTQGLLHSKGRKQVMSMVFTSTEDIPQQALQELLVEALTLDDTVPYAAKRKAHSAPAAHVRGGRSRKG